MIQPIASAYQQSHISLLDYESVDICYGSTKIVQDVSFTVQPGETLGIVGNSGSGKSSLIMAALGLLGRGGVVTTGNIWFEGNNLPDVSASTMRSISGKKIGMIFQDSASHLCPTRTVRSQFFEAMRAHKSLTKKESDERTCELLEKLSFKDPRRILNAYPFELSGGMSQRIGIAMAMLLNPPLILADEPTSVLDASVQKQIVDEMLNIRKLYATAMIIVSHNMQVISAMADSILVLSNGRIVEYGAASDVLNAPESVYTKNLLASVPRLVKN